jgi:hypothetical protein
MAVLVWVKPTLAQAIGNEIKRTLPDKLVLYVSCENLPSSLLMPLSIIT